jgi:two-component sensor histidine kinase
MEGEFRIEMYEIEGLYHLIISDNGVGMPPDINFDKTETLGLILVNTLVNQLEGTVELESINGTQFKIVFKELEYEERI